MCLTGRALAHFRDKLPIKSPIEISISFFLNLIPFSACILMTYTNVKGDNEDTTVHGQSSEEQSISSSHNLLPDEAIRMQWPVLGELADQTTVEDGVVLYGLMLIQGYCECLICLEIICDPISHSRQN